MKSILQSILLLASSSMLVAAPLGSAFIYQGRLTHENAAANGLFEMEFTLHDAVTNGTQIGSAVSLAPVAVTDGVFMARLDFGSAPFNGDARWLQITVNLFGSGQGPTTLIPRQPITAVPYALHAATAGGVMSANSALDLTVGGERALRLELPAPGSPNVIGGASVNTVAPGILGATISGGGTSAEGFALANRIQSNFGSIGGGANNVIRDNSSGSTIAGGNDNRIDILSTAGIIGGGSLNFIQSNAAHSVVGGGLQNIVAVGAHRSTIVGGVINRVHVDSYGSAIGGGYRNLVSAFAHYSTIAGGDDSSIGHYAHHSVVGGGHRNTILERADHSTITGGELNSIATSAHQGFIGGGATNWIGIDSPHSAIVGGWNNNIGANAESSVLVGGSSNAIGSRSVFGVIGGGFQNTIRDNSPFAAIPGGRWNSATNYAFAAGNRAKAQHTGAFVWGDSTEVDVASTNSNSVTMRARGGYRLFTSFNGGAVLAPGDGSWTALSDRNAKENVQPVDTRGVLEKVAALPVSTWNYKSQASDVRHIGPMAQDFKAAFGVGGSDTGITTVDADGVALAAIQGLNQKLLEELRRRDAENADLKQRLEALEKIVLKRED
jgi:trimeric autotransporter adhesin